MKSGALTFADHVIPFLMRLHIPEKLPRKVIVLNPYSDVTTMRLCELFFRKYYSDNQTRKVIIGINPGRHGAGLTGIPFTDPVKLQHVCGIENDLPKKAELSADFIHQVIAAYGGAENFFGSYYFTSVSPLGFMLDGKNMNYYDTPQLLKAVHPFVQRSFRALIRFPVDRKRAWCLGEGENFKQLTKINDEGEFFEEIVPLPHPRFIMQYRRSLIDDYIDKYLQAWG